MDAVQAEPVRLGPGKVLQPSQAEEVVLIGMGASTIQWQQRNYSSDKEWRGKKREIWGINSACLVYRLDLCFSMHTKAVMEGECPWDDYARGPSSVFDAAQREKERQLFDKELTTLHADYKATGTPLVTLDGHDDTLQFPLAEVCELVNSNYFTTTGAYMIAYAMYCAQVANLRRLNLYGFDFDYKNPLGSTEQGRSCVEYWLGRATQGGLQITVPVSSTILGSRTLMEDGLYGFGYQQPRFIVQDGRLKLTHFADMPVKGLPEPEPQKQNGKLDLPPGRGMLAMTPEGLRILT